MGPVADDAVLLLLEALDDPCPDLRAAAAAALGRGTGLPATVVAALTAVLDDRDPEARVAAARALGTLKSSAVAAIPAIRGLLDEPDVRIRTAALESLASIGVETDALIPACIRVLEDTARDSTTLRAPAWYWLYGMRKGGDEQTAVQIAAVRILAKLGAQACAALSALREALDDRYEELRLEAAIALLALRPPDTADAVLVLRQLSRSESESIRAAAQRALEEARR